MVFFNIGSIFTTALSFGYGERNILISDYCIDLLWRPIAKFFRFVLVVYPSRGEIILITTCLDRAPLKVIELYGYRFKIEVRFKHALYVISSYAYHFLFKTMIPLHAKTGNQDLHGKPRKYREHVIRKITAYYCFVQLSCITQGLLLHLSINLKDTEWNSFTSWLRTMHKARHPSKLFVTMAIRCSLPEFVAGAPKIPALKKFIAKNSDPTVLPKRKFTGTG